MLRQLVEALFLHGRIRTTVTRAKEVRPIAEHIITWAKKGTLHHRRMAFGVIYRRDVVNRIFDHIVEWYRNRQGGYTRIIQLCQRAGDGAPVAFLELLDWIPGTEKLVGQNVKQEKTVEGEEGLEGKDKEKKEKEKEKKAKEAAKKAKAPKPEEKKSKTSKDPAKEKKKAERQAAEEKRKQERAAHREKAKKEIVAKKEETKKAEPKKAAPKKATAKKAKPAKGKEKK